MCKINPLIVGFTTTLAAGGLAFGALAGAEAIGVMYAAVGGAALTVASVALTVAMVALIAFTSISAATLIIGAIYGEYKKPQTGCYFFEMMGFMLTAVFENIASVCKCKS